MRRLIGTAAAEAVEPAFDRRRANAHRPRLGPDGAALSPAAIIARAAATVPGEDDASPLPAPEPPRHADDTLVLPTPRPNRRARRRPHALVAARARRAAYTLRHAPLLLVLFGTPLVLWQTGRLDAALHRIGAEADRLYRGAGSAMHLRLRHVRVNGRRRTGLAALRRATGLTPGADVMAIDLDALGRRLERLPWVARAAVARRLPDTVTIRLWEHAPIARFRIGGRTILIGDGGTPIPVDAGPAQRKLLLLAGAGAPEAAHSLLVTLDKAPVLRARVAAAVRRGRRRWDIVFDNRVVLRLPEHHAAAAWLRFARLDRRYNLLARGAASFDMRLRDRLVIRKRVAADNNSG